MAAHAAVTREAAEAGAVLLRTEGAILPLSPETRRIAVIGGHADTGVLSGGGSSQVYPVGGKAVPGIAPTSWPGPVVYLPSSPLAAIRAQAPNAEVRFASGDDPAEAARLARESDVVIVFATQWTGESFDTSLNLRDDKDALIAAVAAANPRTIVVLETAGPVLTPWRGDVEAILEAWYPGMAAGDAVARLLFGDADPGGRLPATFPRAERDLPTAGRPARYPGIDGAVHYSEGVLAGYRWFDRRRIKPAYPFGFGLSYTRFRLGGLDVRRTGPASARVAARVRNVGKRRGAAVLQVYVHLPGAPGRVQPPRQLKAFDSVALRPGAGARARFRLDRRSFSYWDSARDGWRVAPGCYRIEIATSSRDIVARRSLALNGGICRRD
jgi:beta-glucosidase